MLRRARFLIVMASAIFCVLCVSRFVWLSAGPGSWGPRFVCVNPTFDFGESKMVGVLVHSFIIQNTGRKPLHILKARVGCGACLSAEVPRAEIDPGGTGTLKVVLNMSKVEQGPFKKEVLLETDDPQLKKVLFVVKGTGL